MSVRAVPVPRAGHTQGIRVRIPKPGAVQTLWERMADDQDLVELKLVVLAGITLFAMTVEFYLM